MLKMSKGLKASRRIVGFTSAIDNQPARPVEAYRLECAGCIVIEVWTFGATLVCVEVPDKTGRMGNVCLRLPDLAAYEDRAINAYIGSVIGRYGRCVAGGRFLLDGQEFQLDCNIGPHHFHGGSHGFDRHVWDAGLEQEEDALCLRLRLESPDGDQGYPGKVSVETSYRIDPTGCLTIEHGAVTTAPTIIGLTSHTFWNLGADPTIDAHRLAINSGRLVACDADLIPLPGPPVSAASQKADYTVARTLGKDRIDHCYVLEHTGWAAELLDPSSGRSLTVKTDQPGLAVYTGDHLHQPRGGLCLQTTALPDAPNRPDFPGVRLNPGENYTHRTELRFSR